MMFSLFRNKVRGRWFVILGLGRAGRTLARGLLKAEAKVLAFEEQEKVWSSSPVRSLVKNGLQRIRELGNQLGGREPVVIVSPGFAPEHPAVVFFTKKGVMVHDELDFASQFLDGGLIGVTGSNGKSTTVKIIAEILRQAGKRVFVGGNLAPGKPLSWALEVGRKDFYVVEVSSFQLSRSRWFAPKVSVLLNITGDHLDWHRSFAEYVRCKLRIFERQAPGDWAVLNYDDRLIRKLTRRLKVKKLFFSTQRITDGYIDQGWLWFNHTRIAPVHILVRGYLGKGLSGTLKNIERIFNLNHLPVVENALAAICVAGALNIPREAIIAGLKRFSPLEHRLEFVRVLRGVYFFNNSMCTNPQAGIRSLRVWRKKVILIAGGKEKNVDPSDYIRAMSRRSKRIVLIGENSCRLAVGLNRLGFKRYEIVSTMRQAVSTAYQGAKPGEVVLLSPGFASFDLFKDFQARGRAFKNAVRELQ